jgi:hypothetical protein
MDTEWGIQMVVEVRELLESAASACIGMQTMG